MSVLTADMMSIWFPDLPMLEMCPCPHTAQKRLTALLIWFVQKRSFCRPASENALTVSVCSCSAYFGLE